MQIALNDDSEYHGGCLVFVAPTSCSRTAGSRTPFSTEEKELELEEVTEKTGFVVPRRAAGSATVHTHSCVHGVTALTAGVRYGLFLCETKSNTDPYATKPVEDTEMQYLVSAAVEQLDFYEEAIMFLTSSSDVSSSVDALYIHQQNYVEWFKQQQRQRNSEQNQQESNDDEVESTDGVPQDHDIAHRVFAHVHKLNPQYFASCMKKLAVPSSSLLSKSAVQQQVYPTAISTAGDAASFLGVDLVPACRKQLAFFLDVLAQAGSKENCHLTFTQAKRAYAEYLSNLSSPSSSPPPPSFDSVSTAKKRVVPSLLVDHIWHTHMQFPELYATDCLRVCGFEVDHIVD